MEIENQRRGNRKGLRWKWHRADAAVRGAASRQGCSRLPELLLLLLVSLTVSEEMKGAVKAAAEVYTLVSNS